MGEERRSWHRRLITVVVLGAVVSPAVRNRDSFPLSTYPMYASARGERFEIDTVVGFDAPGAPVRLTLALVAEVDDSLLAESAVGSAIASGRSAQLCREVASRVAAADDREVVRVAVVTETHDRERWAADLPAVIATVVHASCPVALP